MNEEWTLELLEEAVAKESGSWLEHVPVNVIRALIDKKLHETNRLNGEYKAALERIRQTVHPKADEVHFEGCTGCVADRVLKESEKRKYEVCGRCGCGLGACVCWIRK